MIKNHHLVVVCISFPYNYKRTLCPCWLNGGVLKVAVAAKLKPLPHALFEAGAQATPQVWRCRQHLLKSIWDLKGFQRLHAVFFFFLEVLKQVPIYLENAATPFCWEAPEMLSRP